MQTWMQEFMKVMFIPKMKYPCLNTIYQSEMGIDIKSYHKYGSHI